MPQAVADRVDGHAVPAFVDGQLVDMAHQSGADIGHRVVGLDLLDEDVAHLVVGAVVLDLVDQLVFHRVPPDGDCWVAYEGRKTKGVLQNEFATRI